MLLYANHTDEVAEGFPPFATIAVEAIPFQSVTTFCACEGVQDANVARIGAARKKLSLMVRPPGFHHRIPSFFSGRVGYCMHHGGLPESSQGTRSPLNPIPSSSRKWLLCLGIQLRPTCERVARVRGRLACTGYGSMAYTTPTAHTLRFGLFELDVRAGELRKRGVRVPLQGLPVQILNILLENPGHIVTRDELRAQLWPADTFVDFDHSLHNAVARLREALGEDAN